MCKIMEELIKKEKIELAKKAIKEGSDIQTIANILELPLSVVKELAQEAGSKEDNKK